MGDLGMGHEAAVNGTEPRRLETAVAGVALGAARAVGPTLVQPVLDHVLSVMRHRHPRAFQAICELPPGRLVIDPVDQPALLLLDVGPKIRLRLGRRGIDTGDATVRGPFARLLDLIEGRIDGDALFFRRELAIEGDTALVVALRNTLDGEDLDLIADLAAAGGPLSAALPMLRRGVEPLAGVLTVVRDLALAPVLQRLDALERRMSRQDGGRR
jgi:predicted lipid carrier protein YhbT